MEGYGCGGALGYTCCPGLEFRTLSIITLPSLYVFCRISTARPPSLLSPGGRKYYRRGRKVVVPSDTHQNNDPVVRKKP
ncbi:hypothetical protein E2C01_056079 [Portunus trituberculatus]|uniref:Uncharacterized protein n=1 Tax=Portunus trituberculatus TaxID=210409 RepID=A0A5B7GPF5_PORTR|nr:hypothetical protein [Portunus trituberculatus]